MTPSGITITSYQDGTNWRRIITGNPIIIYSYKKHQLSNNPKIKKRESKGFSLYKQDI